MKKWIMIYDILAELPKGKQTESGEGHIDDTIVIRIKKKKYFYVKSGG